MEKDYKSTLLMPKTDFEMKANLNVKEPIFQKMWKDLSIYELVLKQNKLNNSFILHDGPPYANGNIHVGHALNKIIKDIIVRQKSMLGYYAPIIYGWDTHGLPIENAISKKDKSFETINDPISKRKACYEYALKQVEIQQSQFDRLGLLTNWEKKYLTLDKTFILDELSLFTKMVEKQLVFQDYKPVFWSWSTKSALADAEIEYYNVTDPAIFVTFNAKENNIIPTNTKFIIWTTTPWTIPSNLAIAVNKDVDYLLFKKDKEYFIIANNLKERVLNKIGFHNYEEVEVFKGSKLEYIKYTHPLYKQREGFIILADYVSNNDGTGLVHNAPGFGLDDYYACKKYNINVFCPIDDDGKFTSEVNDDQLINQFYLKTNDLIIDRLIASNNLLFQEQINHSVAHDWRSKKPVMYRATKQWFVNIDAISDDILKALKKVHSTNQKNIEHIKEMVLKRKEWCISRQRSWGVPIPIIFDENHNPITDIKLIKHIINVLDNEGIDVWFSKPAEYFIPKWMNQSKKYFKEKDIIDVWFDSGSSFNILKHYQLPYPADLYFEGSDQFRGWFNSSLINGVILNDAAPYKYLLQHGFVLDEKGNKMSKSLGNTIDPLKICDEYGADILRLWAASSDYSVDTRIGNNVIKQVAETYRRIRNTLLRFSLSNLSDFDPKKDIKNELRIEDRYVIYRLNKILILIRDSYNNYDFISIVKAITNFTIELSQWYFDIIKDELYCDSYNSLSRRQSQTTIYYILEKLLLALNPILPHTCEEAYQLFNKLNKKQSINLEEFPETLDVVFSDNELNMMKNFFKLKDEIYNKLEIVRQDGLLKKPNEALVIINDNFDISTSLLKRWLNVAEVLVIKENKTSIEIKKSSFKRCDRCWNYFSKQIIDDNNICLRCLEVINK